MEVLKWINCEFEDFQFRINGEKIKKRVMNVEVSFNNYCKKEINYSVIPISSLFANE